MVERNKWTKEWPKNSGWYWFYGIRSSNMKSPNLYMVKVRKVSNGFAYVADGAFLYKEEGAKGVFCKAEIPRRES